jgi:hypothetical protein
MLKKQIDLKVHSRDTIFLSTVAVALRSNSGLFFKYSLAISK